MRSVLTILTILALSALSSGTPQASAAEPELVRDGDRVTGVLLEGGAEVGLALDALQGSSLTARVKAIGDAGLAPEILVYGPDDVRVPAGPRYRHHEGTGKARLKRLTLPVTGRYTIVIRAEDGTSGSYDLRMRATHPRRIRDTGEVLGGSDHFRFPAFAGTVVTGKVKGRAGFPPRADRLLEPGADERDLEGGEADGARVRIPPFTCDRHADHRLLVDSRDGSAGAWKGKLKLAHPAVEARRIVVDGEPAGTFTAGMSVGTPETPPPSPTWPGVPGPGEWWILEKGNDSGIRTPLSMVIRNRTEFRTMWARHRPGTVAPSINWTTQMIVAVFLGLRPEDHEVWVAGWATSCIPWTTPPTPSMWVEVRETWYGMGPVPTPTGPARPFVIAILPRFDGRVEVGMREPL